MAEPTESVLVARLRAVAAQRPDARAVVGAGGDLRYRELWDRVLDTAAELRGHEAPPGSVVALTAQDPAHLATAFMATRAAGLVPLVLDPLLPAERRDAMIAASRPALLVGVADRPTVRNCSATPLILPDEAGYVVFSSGSQGVPKGIIGQDCGLAHFVDWELDALSLGPGRRIAMVTSPSFDVVFREMLLALFSGGELHVAAPVVRTDAAALVPWLAEHAIEVVHLVPSLSARSLAGHAAQDGRLDWLRWTLFAGEPLYAAQVRAWREIAPNARVINLYGPSETTLAKFWYDVPFDLRPGLQPVGRPLPGTELHAEPLPGASDSFRILIETPYGSIGYLPGAAEADRAGLTWRDGHTRFVTQDRGRLDEAGLLSVDGRLDSFVKRRGVFVDVARLEATARAVHGVRLACCVQVDLNARGDLVLAVEVDGELSVRDVRRALRRGFEPEAPDDVVVLDSLPLLPNGKVDRLSLRRQLDHGCLLEAAP